MSLQSNRFHARSTYVVLVPRVSRSRHLRELLFAACGGGGVLVLLRTHTHHPSRPRAGRQAGRLAGRQAGRKAVRCPTWKERQGCFVRPNGRTSERTSDPSIATAAAAPSPPSSVPPSVPSAPFFLLLRWCDALSLGTWRPDDRDELEKDASRRVSQLCVGNWDSFE